MNYVENGNIYLLLLVASLNVTLGKGQFRLGTSAATCHGLLHLSNLPPHCILLQIVISLDKPEGSGFKSQYRILEGHFFTLYC